MWTPATRRQHSRIVTRYQTDLTNAEWRVIAPHLPKPSATGRPREWPMRDIVNGIFYVTRAGACCRTACRLGRFTRFAAWRDDGRFERIPLIELAACGNLSKLLKRALAITFRTLGTACARYHLIAKRASNMLRLASSGGRSPTMMLVNEEFGVVPPNLGGDVNPRVKADLAFGETPSSGALFCTSSIAWCGSLSHNSYDNNISRITANVLDRFLKQAPFET
jgi:transposase